MRRAFVLRDTRDAPAKGVGPNSSGLSDRKRSGCLMMGIYFKFNAILAWLIRVVCALNDE